MHRPLPWVFCVLVSLSLFAGDRVPARFGESSAHERAFPSPVLRASRDIAAASAASLARVSASEIDEIRRWNDAGKIPMRAGVVRALPQAVTMEHRGAASLSTFRCRSTVRVEGASELRLQLSDIIASPATVFWVYGDEGPARAFDASLVHDGVLWTPSVAGDSITIEVATPETSPASLRVTHVAQALDVVASGTECITDVQCHPAILDLASAVGRLTFIEGGRMYACSGALITDRDATFKPYFLTANHCVSSNGAAATAEVVWDFKRTSCGGAIPSTATLPRSTGASLLATAEDTDVTLLLLTSVPGPRSYLGWDSNAVATGTRLQRVSHALGSVQIYSEHLVTNDPSCGDWGPPAYVVSRRAVGGINTGSSGAPVFYDEGFVVGQLTGECGPSDEELDNPCSNLNAQVDGAMAISFFETLAPHLDPPSAGCVTDPTTACLLGNRFRVTINYRNQFSNPPGQTGDFRGTRLNPAATNPDVAIFGFANPQDVEVIVRIVDARPFAPRFDVYYGGLTDVEYWVHVTDTITGTARQYYNAPNTVGGGVDRATFPAN